MAKVGYICHNLRVHPRGRPSDEVPLDNLGGSAGDLLLLLHKRTSELVTAGDSFRDEDGEQALDLTKCERRGRTLRLWGGVGTFGTEGDLRHVRTRRVTHTRTRDEAPLTNLRSLVIVPTDGRHLGIMLSERIGARNMRALLGRAVVPTVRSAADLILKLDATADRPAWDQLLRLGTVEEITYYRPHREAGPTTQSVGNSRIVVESDGPLGISRAMIDAALSRATIPSDVIPGVDLPEDIVSTRRDLVVESNGLRRTVTVDTAFPQFHYDLGGELPDDQFFSAVETHGSQLLSALGVPVPRGFADRRASDPPATVEPERRSS